MCDSEILRHILHDDPPVSGGAPLLVLAHGAGAGMRHPFLASIASGLATRGVAVARFEFPYMQAGRSGPDPAPTLARRFREVVAGLGGGGGVFVGGKSLGGRIASTLADEIGARGLVCLGYPFHPPGKPPTPTRIAHLARLTTPTLIVQGTRDPFGTREEVAAYDLSPAIQLEWLEDGDHSFLPRRRSGYTAQQHLDHACDRVASFVLSQARGG